MATEKTYHAEVARVSDDVGVFFDKTFSSVIYDGPEINPSDYKDCAMMAVCTHRSQADYFMLGHLLVSRLGFGNARFAAGDNLTELPVIGSKFKSYGAFPVYRDKAAGKNYLRALCEQVADMLADGDTLVVFPEGGRSYSGSMMEVRGGLVGANVLAQARNPEKCHMFIPVAISYERLPELRYFDMLDKGRGMRRDKKNALKRVYGNMCYFGADFLAFSKFLMARNVGITYGKLFVDYGEPFSVEALVDIDAMKNPDAKDEFYAHRAAMQKVAGYIERQFHSLYRLLPMHVVAAAIGEKDSAHLKDLEEAVIPRIDWCIKNGRNTKNLHGRSPADIVREGIAQLAAMKGLKTGSDHTVLVRRRSIINYYSAALSS